MASIRCTRSVWGVRIASCSTRSFSKASAGSIESMRVPTDGGPATLHLKSGQTFTGKSFGAPRSVFGETVFSTSITSYTESMTDPSYRGQLLVFTQPLVGNYGVPKNNLSQQAAMGGPRVFLESERIQCAGVIVADLAERYSHYQAVESLSQWCARYGVPGITGVDTRAITCLLREQGTTLGRLAVGPDHEATVAQSDFWDPSKENLVAQASTPEPYTLNPTGDVKVALLDFGAKANIARSLVKRGACVTVLPWNHDINADRHLYDGLFISNGPGDPGHCMEAAMNVRRLINEWDGHPVAGICMGNQIIGLAAGLKTYRMSYGNRGHNQPVLALATSGTIKAGRIYVTSQNHQYAVELQDPFPDGWEPFFINANTMHAYERFFFPQDSSVEGIRSTDASGKQVWGVQFHPESAGGPLDTMTLFDDFIGECRKARDAARFSGSTDSFTGSASVATSPAST